MQRLGVLLHDAVELAIERLYLASLFHDIPNGWLRAHFSAIISFAGYNAGGQRI
jgi:hypothetical protein